VGCAEEPVTEPATVSRIRFWAGHNSAACLVIIVVLALTMCLPIAFLFVAMTSENSVGFASPIFFVPVGMLVVLGVPLAILAVAWVRRVRPRGADRTSRDTSHR
jgi:membrane protein implicated in regulation of membrane protease activity